MPETPYPIADLHAHPSLKTFFGGRKFGKSVVPKKGFNPFGLRSHLPGLTAGGVRLLWSSIYVPEKELRNDCGLFKAAPLLVPSLRRSFAKPAKDTALDMLDHVERVVADVDATPGLATGVVVARSYAEVETALAAGDIAVVHTIEGAHVLDGAVAAVDEFAARGVASITLAHFYRNGVAPPVDAVPDDMFLKKLGCFRLVEDLSLGLPLLGAQVVERMFELGVVVDLTHCTPQARRDVYALPNYEKRPLVMTHVGVRALKDHPINPDDTEIRTIADTGGVTAVIFYNEWLTDADFRQDRNDRLVHVVETVKHMVGAGGDGCVAFGSDFDGMTDPPDDLKGPAEFPALLAALENAGFTARQIEAFATGNAMRVLRDGWG